MMDYFRVLRRVAVLTGVMSFTCSTMTLAAISAEERASIGLENTVLTLSGAIRAGNAEGTIPEWKNEPIVPPANFKPGTFHTNPFADDPVLFVITAQNYEKYADNLTVGQKALFKTYPDYTMNVYKSRRSAVYKPYIYDAALKNLDRAEIDLAPDVGMGVVGFKGARKAWAFPIPHDGNEAWLNQATRPLIPYIETWENTLAVTSRGKYVVNKLAIQMHLPWSDPAISDEDFDEYTMGLLYYQTLIAPAKLAGQVVLAKDPSTFNKNFRRAWAYSPGQRRVKRAPQIVYDNPLTASDGLATTDQKFGFNGPNDRFSYKLLGKREIYVPYNAYKLHTVEATPKNVINEKGRVNQDFARYELHRVWIVDATLKEGTNHDYGRRTFYLDEDSWWIMLADGYDRRNEIWRLWETHSVMYYDAGFLNPTADFQYDMHAGRLFVSMSDKKNPPDTTWYAEDSYFTPASVRRNGIR